MPQVPRIHLIPDTDVIREETFEGRTHLVVPLIALVEGVLNSANADQPELAPASEFGKFPSGWDGRPVTMNHPKVSDQFVSANSPAVLNDWAIGQLFNTRLVDKKLKTEAWIDIVKAGNLNEDSQELLVRLESNEAIEVSTGLFVEVIQVHGVHEGEEFNGIWSNTVPDHLAMLPAGTIGACSIEDGCGAPRLNVLSGAVGGGGRTLRAVTLQLQPRGGLEPLKGVSRESGESGYNAAQGGPKVAETQKRSNEKFRKEAAARCNNLSTMLVALAFPQSLAAGKLTANEFPGSMPINDVRKILADALDSRADIDFFDVRTFTREEVVFEVWNDMKFRSMNFDLTEEGEVTFTSEPVEVNLLTRISPRVNASDGDITMAGNEPKAPASPPTKDAAPVTVGAEPAAPAAAPVMISSMTELIPMLSPDLRVGIEAGQQLIEEQISADVTKVLANPNNGFTEAELRGMDPRTLSKAAKLAEVTPAPTSTDGPAEPAAPAVNLTGVAAPMRVVPQVNENMPPPPPEAFPRKDANGSANGRED